MVAKWSTIYSVAMGFFYSFDLRLLLLLRYSALVISDPLCNKSGSVPSVLESRCLVSSEDCVLLVLELSGIFLPPVSDCHQGKD